MQSDVLPKINILFLNTKKYLFFEGFVMLQSQAKNQFFILHFIKLVSEIKSDFIRKFWFHLQQLCHYDAKSRIRHNSDYIK